MLSNPNPAHQSRYRFRIRIAGVHSDQWSRCFQGVALFQSPEGDSLLEGEAVDEAALFGILRTVEALGAPLISIVTWPANGGRG